MTDYDSWACPVCGASNDLTVFFCWECGWEKDE